MNYIDYLIEAAELLERRQTGRYSRRDPQAPQIFLRFYLCASAVCNIDPVFAFLEAEHGYASTLPSKMDLRSITKRPKTKKSQGNRYMHALQRRNIFGAGGN